MQKLKKAFASLTGPKPPGNTSPQKSETPESRYEAARDQFLAYNAQLDGMKRKVRIMLESTESFCHSCVDLSEGVVPALSHHNGLRGDAGGYLNVMTTVNNTVSTRFRKAVATAVLNPLDSILSIHSELKRRVAERERALKQYNALKRNLHDLQKKSVSKLGSGAGTSKSTATGPSTADVAKRAELVNNLSASLTLYNTLTECLTDEFKTVLSVRDQVVAELFARLRSCQAYFFLGCGSAFIEAEADQVLMVAAVASPLHAKSPSGKPVLSIQPPLLELNHSSFPETNVASDSSRSLVAHHPLPSRPSLQDCILALTAIQESPALRWEALGRENRPKRSLLHRSVPLNDAFDMKSPKSTLLASPTKAGRASSVKLPGKPPKPPLRGCENQMMVMPCARAVLLSRKKWIRRVLLGLTIADLALVSRVCVTWRDVVKNDGKLWDQCAMTFGVCEVLRPVYWEWLTGASGRGVPNWRRECIGSDAEVAVGGMMCDDAQFRMLKSFADTEAAKEPVWAGEIDQDVARTYVEGVRFGESRKRRHVGVGSLQRLRMRSVAEHDVDEVDGDRVEIDVVPMAASLELETFSVMGTPQSSYSGTVTSSDDVVVDGSEPEASSSAIPRQRRETTLAWKDIDSKLDVSVGPYNITQLVTMSLFSDDEADDVSPPPQSTSLSAPVVALVSIDDGNVLASELVTPGLTTLTFAEFGVASPTAYAGLKDPAPSTSPQPSVDSREHHMDAVVSSPPEFMRSYPAPASPSTLEPMLSQKRSQLCSFLRVIAVTEPAVSYTQGLNFVASMLLETTGSQCRSFNLLKRMFRQYDMHQLFATDLRALGLRFYQFERLMCRYLPKLQSHLASEHVSPAMYASSWFLTVFSSFSALDLPTTQLVWDRFLTAGWKEVFRFALAIMQCLEPHVMGQPFEVMLPILQAPRSFCEGDRRAVVAYADGFHVTKRLLSELESDFGITS